MEEISLREIFLIFRRRMWLIFILVILSIIVSGIVSYYVIVPEYETFITLMVGKPKDYQSLDNQLEYNDLLLNQRLVSTYGEIVKSRVVTDKVIENLGLDMSFADFGKKVSVSLVKDTEIIKLIVTDENPILAAKIANETAEVFMESVKDIMMVENIQIIDEAQVPKKPISPRPKLNMAIAGILGLMVGIFLSFLLEYLDNTIKTPEDVEKYLGLSVIGTIPMVSKND